MVNNRIGMEFVGRTTKENANAMLVIRISQGPYFGLDFANKSKYNAIDNNNIEGPCCHVALLAVDQADVQNAKIKTNNIEYFGSSRDKPTTR